MAQHQTLTKPFWRVNWFQKPNCPKRIRPRCLTSPFLSKNCCSDCTSRSLSLFPSNAFMAFARSLHTFNRSKKMNCKLSCKAVYASIASKALVMDQYTVQWAIPSNTKQTKKRQTHQNTTTPKTKQGTEKWDRYQHWEMRCTVTSCVSSWVWPEKEAKQRQPGKTQGGHRRGWKKQQSSMRKPGIPPARIPEITESSHSGITFTQALRSKQRRRRVATRVVRNEKGEIGGETWSKVRMTAVATAFRAHSESAQ